MDQEEYFIFIKNESKNNLSLQNTQNLVWKLLTNIAVDPNQNSLHWSVMNHSIGSPVFPIYYVSKFIHN